MTAVRLIAARWTGNRSGATYYGLFNPADSDDAARLRRIKSQIGLTTREIEIDFDPIIAAPVAEHRIAALTGTPPDFAAEIGLDVPAFLRGINPVRKS